MPEAAERLERIDALLELHIEQGPVLEEAGRALGVPRGAVGVERLRVTFTGQAAHAGTTPLPLRRDAGAAAARLALAAREAARAAGGLATAGALRLEPGIVTAVAGRAELLVDLRHEHQQELLALRAAVERAAAEIAADERVEVEVAPLWATPAVPFDSRLVAALEEAVGDSPALVSGALHDSVAVQRTGVPAAMLFVRSIGGIESQPRRGQRRGRPRRRPRRLRRSRDGRGSFSSHRGDERAQRVADAPGDPLVAREEGDRSRPHLPHVAVGQQQLAGAVEDDEAAVGVDLLRVLADRQPDRPGGDRGHDRGGRQPAPAPRRRGTAMPTAGAGGSSPTSTTVMNSTFVLRGRRSPSRRPRGTAGGRGRSRPPRRRQSSCPRRRA